MNQRNRNWISLNDNYIYTPSTTNIAIRWRKNGWLPPTEDPAFHKKWADFRIQCAQGIESLGRVAPQFNPSVIKWKT